MTLKLLTANSCAHTWRMFNVLHTWRTESETDLSRRENAMGTRCKKIIGARGITLRLDLDEEAARGDVGQNDKDKRARDREGAWQW